MAQQGNNIEQEFGRLASLVEAHVNHYSQQFRDPVHWQPGTPAAVDAAEIPQLGEAWTEEPLRTYLSIVRLKLTLATDHLNGLAELLEPPFTLYAWASVARQALEASGRAYWLLDPDLTVRERVGRSLAERLKSLHQERDLHRLASEPGDWDPEAVETDIRAEAARLGVGELEPLPSATEVVRQVLSEHYGRPQAGAVVYKALCAMSHGAIYGLLARFREVGPSDTSYARKMAPHLSPTLLREVVRGVVLGHISAVDRAVAYYGCSSPEFWTSWLNKLTSDF